MHEPFPKVLAVVPARYASTRFPGKMLADLGGKPLVFHAYERAREAMLVQDTVIAADDDRIRLAVEPLGAKVVMTRAGHATGTDRVAEVALMGDATIIVNVQGDEALIDPNVIDETIRPMLADPSLAMTTACRVITDPAVAADPNVVKVVMDNRGHALYFSRAPIPFVREQEDLDGLSTPCYQHIGLYAFRRDFLLAFSQLPQTRLEKLEKLEQLRALEYGYKIAVIETTYNCIGVDTPEDLDKIRALMQAREQLAD